MDAANELLSGPVGMAFAFVWGAIWGSFFNVVIVRLPAGQSIVRPASRCGACGAAVRAFDNVPVLSYLWLRGRCRACGARFSARYPLTELVTALLSLALWWLVVTRFPAGAGAFRLGRFSLYFAFVGLLVVLAAIDLDTKRLPDVLTLPGAGVLFVAAFAVRDVPWSERAVGAVAGYLFVRVIADFYYYVLHREGLGLGDGKLLALVGAVLGWRTLPSVVFLGSILGTLISVPALLLGRLRGREASGAGTGPAESSGAAEAPSPPVSLRHVEVPFGPFLVLAALADLAVFLYTGQSLLDWTGVLG